MAKIHDPEMMPRPKHLVVVQACDNVDYEESDWVCYITGAKLADVNRSLKMVNARLAELHEKVQKEYTRIADEDYAFPFTKIEETKQAKRYFKYLRECRAVGPKFNIVGSRAISLRANKVQVL